MKIVQKKRLREIGIDTSEYKDCIFYVSQSQLDDMFDLIVKDMNTNEVVDIFYDEFDQSDVDELTRQEE